MTEPPPPPARRSSQFAIVLSRELREGFRRKAFRVSALVLLAASTLGVLVPRIVADEATTLTIAGPATSEGAVALRTAALALEVPTATISLDNPAEIRAAVDDGLADVGVLDGEAIVAADPAGSAEPRDQAIAAGLRIWNLRQSLESAGVAGVDVTTVLTQSVIDVEILDQGSARRVSLGLIFSVLLAMYYALITSSRAVAATVSEEKSTRIAELLLASVRASTLMRAKILAGAVLGAAQLAIAAAPLLVSSDPLAGITAGDVAWLATWFVAGYALSACAFGAVATLVRNAEDVHHATTPLVLLTSAGVVLGIQVAQNAGHSLADLGSIVPFTAPFVMTARLGTDVSAIWAGAALASTVVATVVLARVAERHYGRSIGLA